LATFPHDEEGLPSAHQTAKVIDGFLESLEARFPSFLKDGPHVGSLVACVAQTAFDLDKTLLQPTHQAMKRPLMFAANRLWQGA
jgi:hypothetical protein